MGSVAIFSGNFAKTLKANLNLFDKAYILTGTDNPTIVPKNAPKGSLYLRQTASGDGEVYVKNDNGNTTNWQNLNKLKIRQQTLLSNQVNQNITDLVASSHFLKVIYAIHRKADLESDLNSNAIIANKFNNSIITTIVQPDGKILVGGGFTDYNSVIGRNYLIRLNADGTLDTAFTANASDGNKFNSSVRALALQPDGKILVGGSFVDYNSVSGRDRLIRLNPDGTLDTAFTVNASDGSKFNSFVIDLSLQPDGKILVGGNFINYNSVSGRDHLIRLNPDGTLDTAFTAIASDGAKFNTFVHTFVLQPDSKILVGGDFTNYNSVSGRNRLIRLNSDGTLDTVFTANASDGAKFNSIVFDLSLQPDGKILVVGDFFNYNSVIGRNYLIRLNADGTLDTAFTANASDGAKFDSQVRSLALQPDGKILVGGDFIDYNSVSGRNRLIRLNPDGTLDTAFAINFVDNKINNNDIQVIAVSNNNILVGGGFTNYNSVAGLSYFLGIADRNKVEVGNFTAINTDYKYISGQEFDGEDTGVTFSIDNLGQLKYSSTNEYSDLFKLEWAVWYE